MSLWRVFHIDTVWSYSLCINENFDFYEDQAVSLIIIAVTFCIRFWSFCLMTFSYSPYNCFFILSNILIIICSTEIAAKILELCIWVTRLKLVLVLTTEESIKPNVLNHWKAKAIKLHTEIKQLKHGKW